MTASSPRRLSGNVLYSSCLLTTKTEQDATEDTYKYLFSCWNRKAEHPSQVRPNCRKREQISRLPCCFWNLNLNVKHLLLWMEPSLIYCICIHVTGSLQNVLSSLLRYCTSCAFVIVREVTPRVHTFPCSGLICQRVGGVAAQNTLSLCCSFTAVILRKTSPRTKEVVVRTAVKDKHRHTHGNVRLIGL